MMIRVCMLLMLSVLMQAQSSTPAAKPATAAGTSMSDQPEYTADGRLLFPANYREWIYLSSGLDMSYSPRFNSGGHSMFDNVFVNPTAYKAFLETGTWPDKTMLVLEVRGAGSNASINKSGHFQTTEMMGTEVHLRDQRLPGKWAFFSFDDPSPSKAFPHEMQCYSCHEAHGAVDTSFVQFYPTLIKLAEQKGTLSSVYKNESKAK